MKERIKWLDVAKAIGIFLVYLCHFNSAGRGYTFSHTCSVQFFFFISGCAENLSKEENALKYIFKKFKTVLVPAYFFALLSVAVHVIEYNLDYATVQHTLILIAYGMIRNAFFAQTLWFLTCLFVMQIMFFFIKKLGNKFVILGVALSLYIFYVRFLPLLKTSEVGWSYNADYALYYMIYYAIGYVAYPYIVELFKLDTFKRKIVFGVSGTASLYYTLRFFFGVDLYSSIPWPSVAYYFTPILVTGTIIWACMIVARVMQDVKGLDEIGKNTLYLCGNEWIVKTLVVHFFAIFGIGIGFYSPIQMYIYIGILLIVVCKFLTPIEKYILKKIVG